MAIHDFKQSFNAGELSEFMDSRVAVEKYASGCQVMENLIPQVHGPAVKRAGSVMLDGQENPSQVGRLIGWNFSDGTYSVAEFSDAQVRFWSDDVTVTGVIATVYGYAQLARIKWAHINNVIYMVERTEEVQRITRSSISSQSIAAVDWDFPPLLDENVTTTTMAISTATAGVGRTLTASASYFTSDNVGSYFEIAHPRTTAYSDLRMGDTATFASGTITITGETGADGDNFTIGTVGSATIRTYTVRTGGRDAADEIDAGDTADDMADNIISAINTGGGGADPHGEVTAEDVGGIKASNTFGLTSANTNFTDNDTVTIGDVTYTFDNVGTWQEDAYVVLLGADLEASLNNLKKCINHTARNPEAPEYWESDADVVLPHPDVEATGVASSGSGFLLTVRAREYGPAGNEIATTESTAGSHAWTAAALSGGTRVIRIKARQPGTAGNSITTTEGAAAMDNFAFSAAALSGGGDESATTSSEIVVHGRAEIRTTGRWKGTVTLQKERTTAVWETVRVWNSNFDYNANETLDFPERTNLRLAFSGTGEEVDTVWPRAVLTPVDAFVRGIVKVTAYTSATQVTATVVLPCLDTSATPTWSEGAWSPRRGYPRAVCFHQNRLWFAGTTYEPCKLWASCLGDFENFKVTSLDDGSLAFQIAASEAQQIQWLAVTHTLVIGTDFGIWVADTADGLTGFTNTSPPIFRQKSAVGCADFAPDMLNDALIYVVKDTRQLRAIRYDENRVFSSILLTVLAEHVTGTGVGNIATQHGRNSIVWAINSDGDLIGMSYDQEQNVAAWHRHPMASSANVESVTVVQGTYGDEVWLTVSRNSSRYTERLHPQTHNQTLSPSSQPSQYCHVDGSIYDSTAGTGVTGLTHLNSLGVIAWGLFSGSSYTLPALSGTTQPTYTASGGAITLTASATNCWVGTPMVSKMTTMKPDYPLKSGSSVGRVFKITAVNLKLKDSSGGVLAYEGETQAGAGAVAVVTVLESGNTGLRTRQTSTKLTSRYREDAVVTIEHISAGPFTLTGLVTQVDVGGASNAHPPSVTA